MEKNKSVTKKETFITKTLRAKLSVFSKTMQNHFPLTLETAVATLNLYCRPSLDAELFMFRVLLILFF